MLLSRLAATTLALGIASQALAAAKPATLKLATGAQIKAAISGNTVEGQMAATGPYAELYAADGTIRAKDYTAKWTIKRDTMCFIYGDDEPLCWSARIEGDRVTWIHSGREEGSGTIKPGNPNNF